ncbi:MAG TPA: 2-oxo acid dehydrogenase subunit E2 [Phototrophicaceae bacterium]|nr:2-oxo acid dehydrogenase subunit E2 [Phototrophicaceae bacterium]
MADPSYQTRPISAWRATMSDALTVARQKNYVHGLIEIDVTEARRRIHAYKANGGDFSFTAFLIACIARAVAENKAVHGLRQGNQIVIFDDVDVTTQIEHDVDGEKVVSAHIIRAANCKTARQIHEEIRAAQAEQVTAEQPMAAFPRWVWLAIRLPRFIRLMALRRILGNPFTIHALGGTVNLTAVGMVANGGGWGIPIAETGLIVAIGGIDPQVRCMDGQFCVREMLAITLSFDHDVIDGAPAARFAARLRELVESAYGLE